MHVDFIYAQKDSFAHRYGILEICGAFAVGFRLIRPGRPLPARSLPPARGGWLLLVCVLLVCVLMVCGHGRWLCWCWPVGSGAAGSGLRKLVCWPLALLVLFRGKWLLRLFVLAGTIIFYPPRIAWRPGR